MYVTRCSDFPCVSVLVVAKSVVDSYRVLLLRIGQNCNSRLPRPGAAVGVAAGAVRRASRLRAKIVDIRVGMVIFLSAKEPATYTT